MNVGGDLTVWCFECDCIGLIFALILGISICVSVCRILKFFKWKIRKEQEFDQAIFENFKRGTLLVGDAQSNGQNNYTKHSNGNARNSGVPKGQQ